MAGRKRRHRERSKDDLPGWVWMMFGLAVGLTPAVLIYLNSRQADPPAMTAPPAPANRPGAIDDNGETAAGDAGPSKPRFDFYSMLPNFEVVIPEQEPDVSADNEPRAIVRPGVYVLQAGSFSTYDDADRRRAQLALHGIESRIQRVSIDDKTYHRVRIGPIDDLDELNVLRARLRQAKIDVLRIRLAD